jgi:hypothetical protein
MLANQGIDVDALLRHWVDAALGWTSNDKRHALRMAEIGEDGLEEVLDEITKRHRVAEKAAARTVLKRRRTRAA